MSDEFFRKTFGDTEPVHLDISGNMTGILLGVPKLAKSIPEII